ncbi:glycosyltransferase [Duncaniella muris]|uniref:glycosyltransferase n=1 Tax=Duncaniella muris TaxID=2094150 RepID=UPI00272E1EC8|nr:glycosyltransferase [Duncaniella muris]
MTPETGPNLYGLFNDSFPPVLDGVTLTVENYCQWLAAAGHKVCVVTPWTPGPCPEGDFTMYRYLSLPIYNRHPYRYGYPRFDPFIWRKLRSTPFRLVHAHCPFSSGRLAAYAARKHDIPLVATFHSKYRTDLERSLPGPMVRYQMKRLLEFYNSATEVWIPQSAVEETLREYGYTGDVKVVENGNDFSEGISDLSAYRKEARRHIGLADDEFGLLFVGQHILEKGIEIIVRALAGLAGLKFHMNFIGTGYALHDMQELTRELGLSAHVAFHGVIDNREDLRRFYAASDLFLFPSFYDNAPLVVREAAAMSTPSLLLEGSTAAELVRDGDNGFLTRRTPEAYAAAIRAIASDPIMKEKAGHGARATLARSWHDVMDEVLIRYAEITDRYEHNCHKK